MADQVLEFAARYGNGLLIGAGLLVLAGCQWWLMRHEPPRRAGRETRIIVNGRECRTIAEARREMEWLEMCGVTRVVQWPEAEEMGEPVEAAAAAGGEYESR